MIIEQSKRPPTGLPAGGPVSGVDIGPIHVTAEKTKTLPLSPIVGAIAVVGGIVLLVAGKKEG